MRSPRWHRPPCGPRDLTRARQTGGYVERADRSRGQGRRAAAGVRRGRPAGDDLGASSRPPSPRSTPPGPRATRWSGCRGRRWPPRSPPGWCPRCASAWSRWRRGRPGSWSPTAPALKVGLVGLLGWPTAQATALQGVDNCGWATVAESPAGRLRLAGYNQQGRHRGGRFRIRRPGWLRFPSCPAARRGRRGCGAAGSAPPWHGGGQGFESPQLHKNFEAGQGHRRQRHSDGVSHSEPLSDRRDAPVNCPDARSLWCCRHQPTTRTRAESVPTRRPGIPGRRDGTECARPLRRVTVGLRVFV